MDRLRYLVPVVGPAEESPHLAAACRLVGRDGEQVIALVIGLVPSSLPMGADVPDRWSRLEYEAARARRFGRQHGVEVETALALSDQAGAAVVALAEELGAGAICLGYERGWRADLRRWRDELWQTILDQAPCPIVLECSGSPGQTPSVPSRGRLRLWSRSHGAAG